MGYRDSKDRTENMRLYREHKMEENKRRDMDRIHQYVSRIAKEMGVKTRQVFGYRSVTLPKEVALQLRSDQSHSSETKLYGSRWLWTIGYVANKALSKSGVIRNRGPHVFGVCVAKTAEEIDFIICRFLALVKPGEPLFKGYLRIHFLVVENEERVLEALLRHHYMDFFDHGTQESAFYGGLRTKSKEEEEKVNEFANFLNNESGKVTDFQLQDFWGKTQWREVIPLDRDENPCFPHQRIIVRANNFMVFEHLWNIVNQAWADEHSLISYVNMLPEGSMTEIISL